VTDDEFKAAVMKRFDAVDARLNAIVARLDEQDAGHDRLLEKVDRMSHAVRDALDASEQALSSITTLSRRVLRLEYPDT